jgi:hypothetical protein
LSRDVTVPARLLVDVHEWLSELERVLQDWHLDATEEWLAQSFADDLDRVRDLLQEIERVLSELDAAGARSK